MRLSVERCTPKGASLVMQADNDALLKACEEACHERHLCPSPGFLAKVMQLYETMLVRHGLMLVGSPLAGKTCAYRVLQAVSDPLHVLMHQPMREHVRWLNRGPAAGVCGRLLDS
jgi:hypothetical protein